MITNPVHSLPAVQHEAAAKAAPASALQQASIPPDKVTISPQAQAQVQAQAHAHAQQTASAAKTRGGDHK
jgi:hypothetical protein